MGNFFRITLSRRNSHMARIVRLLYMDLDTKPQHIVIHIFLLVPERKKKLVSWKKELLKNCEHTRVHAVCVANF